MTCPTEGVDCRPNSCRTKNPARSRSEGIFPLPQLLELSAWSPDGLTEVQRRRLLRDASRAYHALNWMQGEGHRPSPLVVSEDKIQCLRADVQQRVILAALQWIDADSAADEHETLASLLKGRTGHVLGVSSTVASNEYSRVSLPDSVVDAPPLIEMLPAEAKVCLEEFQSRMLLPPEVTAVIGEIRRRTWMPQRSAIVAWPPPISAPCPTNDEDWAHCPHPSTCLCAWRLLRKKREKIVLGSLLTVARRMPCLHPATCRAGVRRRTFAY